MSATERVINDLNVAKLMLCNPQVLTPEMCVKIGQAINSAIDLFTEQEQKSEEQKASGAWKFVGYTTFDSSLSSLYRCANCRYTTRSMTKYCPMFRSKNQP